MLAKADLFLVDVELFKIEDHLLLEALLVGLGREVFEILLKAGADRVNALCLKAFHFVFEVQDVLHAARYVFVKGLAFLGPELFQGLDGLGYRLFHRGPGLFGDDFLLAGVNDVREAEDAGKDLGFIHAKLLCKGAELAEIFLHEKGVDGLSALGGIGLPGDEKVYRSAP